MEDKPARLLFKTVWSANIFAVCGVFSIFLPILQSLENLPPPYAGIALGWVRWMGMVFWLYFIVRLCRKGAEGNRSEYLARLFGCLAAVFYVAWQAAGLSPGMLTGGEEALRLAYCDFGIHLLWNSLLVFGAAWVVARPVFRLGRRMIG